MPRETLQQIFAIAGICCSGGGGGSSEEDFFWGGEAGGKKVWLRELFASSSFLPNVLK